MKRQISKDSGVDPGTPPPGYVVATDMPLHRELNPEGRKIIVGCVREVRNEEDCGDDTEVENVISKNGDYTDLKNVVGSTDDTDMNYVVCNNGENTEMKNNDGFVTEGYVLVGTSGRHVDTGKSIVQGKSGNDFAEMKNEIYNDVDDDGDDTEVKNIVRDNDEETTVKKQIEANVILDSGYQESEGNSEKQDKEYGGNNISDGITEDIAYSELSLPSDYSTTHLPTQRVDHSTPDYVVSAMEQPCSSDYLPLAGKSSSESVISDSSFTENPNPDLYSNQVNSPSFPVDTSNNNPIVHLISIPTPTDMGVSDSKLLANPQSTSYDTHHMMQIPTDHIAKSVSSSLTVIPEPVNTDSSDMDSYVSGISNTPSSSGSAFPASSIKPNVSQTGGYVTVSDLSPTGVVNISSKESNPTATSESSGFGYMFLPDQRTGQSARSVSPQNYVPLSAVTFNSNSIHGNEPDSDACVEQADVQTEINATSTDGVSTGYVTEENIRQCSGPGIKDFGLEHYVIEGQVDEDSVSSRSRQSSGTDSGHESLEHNSLELENGSLQSSSEESAAIGGNLDSSGYVPVSKMNSV